MDNNQHTIFIKKASGEREAFNRKKLKQSLLNVGTSGEIAENILHEIEHWIYEDITTKKIYAKAFSLLKKKKRLAALKYKLKQAMLELGPSGYPFEILIGEIFRKDGYQTEVGVVVDGQCITHEMDVIATKDNVQHLVECKYSTHQGKQVSIQIPLYVHSRTNDIISKRIQMEQYNNLTYKTWVVSNTRFSLDSINYSKCAGIELLSWDFPYKKGLKELLEEKNIYPITVLSQLTKTEKQILLNEKIVLCSQLLDQINNIDVIELNTKRKNLLIQELKDICI